MTISRRKFLKLLGAAAGGSIAGYGMFSYLRIQFPDKVWALNDWLTSPVLEDSPPGSLSEPVLQTLITTVDTLIGMPIETDHYVDFFQWHAETLPGYKALYEQFATTLNDSTRQTTGSDFVECEATVRYEALEKAFQVRAATSRWGRIRVGVFDREWLLFDTHIVREIFSLFSRTDALILLGYATWPGQIQGLDRYIQPPAQLG